MVTGMRDCSSVARRGLLLVAEGEEVVEERLKFVEGDAMGASLLL